MRMANGEMRNGLKRLERGHPQLHEVITAWKPTPVRRCDLCGAQTYALFVLPGGTAVCEGCYSVQLVRRERGNRNQ